MNHKKFAYGIVSVLFIVAHGAKAMDASQSQALSVAGDNVFVWQPDQQYHVLLAHGELGERTYNKRYQTNKQYRAHLVVQKDEQSFLRPVQQCAGYYNGKSFRNLPAPERVLVPTTISGKQIEVISKTVRCDNKKEIVMAIDICNDLYFITHIDDSAIKSSKNDAKTSQYFNKRALNTKRALQWEIDLLRKDKSNLQRLLTIKQSKVTMYRLITSASFTALFAALVYHYFL